MNNERQVKNHGNTSYCTGRCVAYGWLRGRDFYYLAGISEP